MYVFVHTCVYIYIYRYKNLSVLTDLSALEESNRKMRKPTMHFKWKIISNAPNKKKRKGNEKQ